MTIPDRIPFATWRPVSYIGEAGAMTSQLGWILHVVVGNGSPFGTFQNAKSPRRRFSHLWVAKDGSVEQYQSLNRSSWAQGGGNRFYWSVETEGFDSEKLTSAQVKTLARIHRFLGAPDRLAESPGDVGIGTHLMGGKAWGGHACPGRARASQRIDILAEARRISGAASLPPKGIGSPRGPFPLAEGHFYGEPDGTARAHNGAQVRDRQGIMQIQSAVGAAIDGWYGPVTAERVRAYQRLQKLETTGQVRSVDWYRM